MKYKNTFLLLAIIAIIKLFFLGTFVVSKMDEGPIKIVSYEGDADSYIQPIDNLISSGTYIYPNPGGSPVKAGRMPHYGMIYLAFRTFLDRENSLLFLVFLQIFLDIISTLFLLKIIFLFIDRSKIMIAISLALIVSCIYLSWWDLYICPETFSYAFLIFFTYHYILFQRERDKRHLFISTLFLGLAISMKPYYGFFLVFVCSGLIIYYIRKKIFLIQFRQLFISQVIAVSSLIILLAPWTIRNYYAMGKFVPLQQDIYSGFNYDEVDLTLRKYIAAWGGNYIFWDKRSAGCYFNYNLHCLPCEFTMPEYAYCSCYGKNETDTLRNEIVSYQKDIVEGHRSDSVKLLITKKLNNYIDCFAKEKPLFYYLWGPLLRIKNFMIHSGSYYYAVPGKYRLFFIINKLIQSVLYYVLLTTGLIGLFLLLLKHKETWFFFSIIIYLIILFPLVIQGSEWRYFNPAFIYFSIGTPYLIYVSIYNKKRSIK